MSRLLDYDPFTGVSMTFDYDYASDQTIIGYHQDVKPILDWNKSRAVNVDKNKLQAKRELLHYARVPIMAQMDMLQKYGVRFWDKNHSKEVMRLLNTREYADCRISHWKHDR
jgi:hypothetical protein